MTVRNYTKSDEALLVACKHYIRITQSSDEHFIREILDLASQYCDQLPSEIIEKLRTT